MIKYHILIIEVGIIYLLMRVLARKIEIKIIVPHFFCSDPIELVGLYFLQLQNSQSVPLQINLLILQSCPPSSKFILTIS